MVAKRRTVVTFELALGVRVSQVSSFTGVGGVVVAKRGTVITFGLAFGPRVSQNPQQSQGSGVGRQFWTGVWSSRFKSPNSQRDRGGRAGREMLNCRHYFITIGLGREPLGEDRGEDWNREARGEEKGKKEERGERGEESRAERREEGKQLRTESREDDPGPRYPDWLRACGVTILADPCGVRVSVCIRVRGSYQVELRRLFFSRGLFLAAVCPWLAEAATGKLRAPSLRRAAQRHAALSHRIHMAPSHSSALSNGSSRARARCAATANMPVQRWPAATAAPPTLSRRPGSGENPPFRHQSVRPPQPPAPPGDTYGRTPAPGMWPGVSGVPRLPPLCPAHGPRPPALCHPG